MSFLWCIYPSVFCSKIKLLGKTKFLEHLCSFSNSDKFHHFWNWVITAHIWRKNQVRIKSPRNHPLQGFTEGWEYTGVLQFMGSQRVGHDLATELNWTENILIHIWELVMDREAWCAVIHGVAKSRTRLSDWTELNREHTYSYPKKFISLLKNHIVQIFILHI